MHSWKICIASSLFRDKKDASNGIRDAKSWSLIPHQRQTQEIPYYARASL
ncbi:hypothetical protein VCHA54O482_90067 [Vibrio chagasii]|nr:hypothetical protein VCHA36O163_100067 [Vibrio chagasii]CAH6795286.1 hypothetical protein VCHA31O71_100067 [Vibrio chagasii]CAH7442016.1 hypothetical protein VCHA49P382_90105 [Vibrio chagasii]CAH7481254.1 hypothetical protein VCHA54O482_90067 [Vibrio chagasii]